MLFLKCTLRTKLLFQKCFFFAVYVPVKDNKSQHTCWQKFQQLSRWLIKINSLSLAYPYEAPSPVICAACFIKFSLPASVPASALNPKRLSHLITPPGDRRFARLSDGKPQSFPKDEERSIHTYIIARACDSLQQKQVKRVLCVCRCVCVCTCAWALLKFFIFQKAGVIE